MCATIPSACKAASHVKCRSHLHLGRIVWQAVLPITSERRVRHHFLCLQSSSMGWVLVIEPVRSQPQRRFSGIVQRSGLVWFCCCVCLGFRVQGAGFMLVLVILRGLS